MKRGGDDFEVISTENINNQKVKPIKKLEDDIPVKGYELFSEPYANIFICARKNSGKTTLLNHIIQQCAGRKTKVIICSSTADKDASMLHIIKELERRKLNHIVLDGDDVLDVIDSITGVDEDGEEKEPEVYMPTISTIAPCQPKPKTERKREPKKPKKVIPELMLIFDDTDSQILRSPKLNFWLKRNRHYKSKTIISSQYFLDLSTSGRRNLDNLILYGGIASDELAKIYKSVCLSIPYEQFEKLYHIATEKKYHFLYIDLRNCKYRINFDKEFKI